MAVSFHNQDNNFRLRQIGQHRSWVNQVIHSHHREVGDLAFIFTSNAYLLSINRTYLNHNYFTDVITFDYSHEGLIGGDVFISIDKVKENAIQYGEYFTSELRRVMIHGVLHLLGFEDGSEEDRSIMRNMENDALHLWINEGAV